MLLSRAAGPMAAACVRSPPPEASRSFAVTRSTVLCHSSFPGEKLWPVTCREGEGGLWSWGDHRENNMDARRLCKCGRVRLIFLAPAWVGETVVEETLPLGGGCEWLGGRGQLLLSAEDVRGPRDSGGKGVEERGWRRKGGRITRKVGDEGRRGGGSWPTGEDFAIERATPSAQRSEEVR